MERVLSGQSESQFEIGFKDENEQRRCVCVRPFSEEVSVQVTALGKNVCSKILLLLLFYSFFVADVSLYDSDTVSFYGTRMSHQIFIFRRPLGKEIK